MMHSDGISAEGDLIDLGLAAKLIEKSGTWIRYNDSHLGAGERERHGSISKRIQIVAEEIRQKIVLSREPLVEVEPEAKAEPEA